MSAEDLLQELALRIGRVVVAELRGIDQNMVEQSGSPLGRNRHVAAVKRRLAQGKGGAHIVGRRHLLTREALQEELDRKSQPGVARAKANGSTLQQSAKDEMMARLRMVRS
ncbi:MAG TPA: hypothetical protein VIU86_19865 [Gaiellaceae bacterium]